MQFGTGLAVNPLHTLLLACVVAALLVWILNFVDLQPLYNLDEGKDVIEVPAQKDCAPQNSTSSVYASPSPVTLESITASVISEAPAQETSIVVVAVDEEHVIAKPHAIPKSKTTHHETTTKRDEL